MTRKQRHGDYTNCPVEAALDVLGGKWKAVIVHHLLQRTWRFNELRRALPRVTQRMLTNQLRELETDGIIHREAYPEVPPRVEYSLTERGRSLAPLLSELQRWGMSELDRRHPPT